MYLSTTTYYYITRNSGDCKALVSLASARCLATSSLRASRSVENDARTQYAPAVQYGTPSSSDVREPSIQALSPPGHPDIAAELMFASPTRLDAAFSPLALPSLALVDR